MMSTIRQRNSLSTALLFIRLLSSLPIMPPPMPPATMSTRVRSSNSGTVPLKRVVSRLVIWLNRMMYRLFCAATFVRMAFWSPRRAG